MMLLFFPLILMDIQPKSGLALSYYYESDVSRFGWFYQWGPYRSNDRQVPMTYDGLDPLFEVNYSGFLLVFNEPDLPYPFGCGLTPALAAARYNELAIKYPRARMVVGNTSQGGVEWIKIFRANIQKEPYAWGIHAYSNSGRSPYYTIRQVEQVYDLVGGKFWITEWSDTGGDLSNTEIFYNWLQSTAWIERWAYYTNRVNAMDWTPSTWTPQLWSWDGQATEVGSWILSKLQIDAYGN